MSTPDPEDIVPKVKFTFEQKPLYDPDPYAGRRPDAYGLSKTPDTFGLDSLLKELADNKTKSASPSADAAPEPSAPAKPTVNFVLVGSPTDVDVPKKEHKAEASSPKNAPSDSGGDPSKTATPTKSGGQQAKPVKSASTEKAKSTAAKSGHAAAPAKPAAQAPTIDTVLRADKRYPAPEDAKPETREKRSPIVKAILTWFAIISGATTLMGNLQPFLTLAASIKRALDVWHRIISTTWRLIFGFIQVDMPSYLISPLTLAAFILLAGLSTRATFGADKSDSVERFAYVIIDVLKITSIMLLWGIALAGAVSLLQLFPIESLRIISGLVLMAGAVYFSTLLYRYAFDSSIDPREIPLIAITLIFSLPALASQSSTFLQVDRLGLSALAAGSGILLSVLISDSEPLKDKLYFILIGLVFLIGLNEIAKLGLSSPVSA